MTKVEFLDWKTPFEQGDITLIEVNFKEGANWLALRSSGLVYRFDEASGLDGCLVARLFHCETETIYKLVFNTVGAYRVLDEHGLNEFADIQKTTFRVRNHSWLKESPLSFHMYTEHDWSFVIYSDGTCLEVLCCEEPLIEMERKVVPEKLGDCPDVQCEMQ